MRSSHITKTEYYPDRVIACVHEHKKAYQPNMAKAIGLVLLASALFAVCFVYRPPNNPANALHPGETILTGESGTGTTAAKARAVGLDFRPPAYRTHEGFAGFKGYRVSPESNPTTALTVFHPTEYTSVSPDVDFAALRIGSTDITLPLYGTGDDCGDGLPGSMTFLDMSRPSGSARWQFPGIGTGTPNGSGRQPPILQFARVRYPKKGEFIDGHVSLIIGADRAGRLRDIEVVSEEPAGHDFANAVKDALDRSLYWPPKVNGDKVPYRFQLTYEFCWNCRRQSAVEVVSGDMIVASTVRKPFQPRR